MFTTGLPTYVPSLFVTNGVNGGFVNFSSQSEVPPLPTGGATIYADSNNDLVIDGPRGFSATLSRELLTKSQVYSLPDLSGSLVLLGEGTNTILGNESMTQITTGGNNVSIGYNSGNDVTSGSGNVIVGSDAAAAMVSTNDCVIVGYGAGATNVNDGLVAVGAGAAASCVDASGVTAIGTGAGQNNTVDGLTAVGYNSLNAVTTGLNNTAIGSSSGLALTTGSNNICVGANSANGATDATAVSNIYIGTGTTTSESISNSIIMGTDASSSVSNEFMLPLIKHFNLPLLSTDTVGTGTLLQIGGTNADYVVASGGTYNSVAAIDTAITALQNDIIVSGTNMAIGGESFGATVTGADCTATGDGALKSLTGGSWNTAFGYNALGSTTTNFSNVAFGDSALGSCLGSNNTAVGSSALHELTTGISNVGIGAEAGASLTTGSNNVCIGTSSNVYSDACSGAIILGASATNTASDQLYISPTITSFNISGLAASTGTGAGTILEFDSTGNILPSAGTYNSVSKIDSAIGAAGGICPLDSSTQVSPTYLPPATPTKLGAMYGVPPNSTANTSLALGYGSQAPGTWSIAIGNNVLTSAEDSSLCNVAVGSQNFINLTTGSFNTAIGQNSSNPLTTGSNNVTLGYNAGGGTDGFVTGSNNIAIGYNSATSTNDAAVSNNIYIGPYTVTSTTGVSNSIMMGSGATSGVSNEFMISNIDHLNIPSLTTSSDGTGTLLQWGGANTGWVQASGGTYNSVAKIDNAIGAANGICPLDSSTQVSPTYLPSATPTTLGVLYGTPPTPSYVNSSLSLGANANAAGTWSIAIGNDVLTSAEGSTQCNVAIGSYNLKNLTTGQYNTAIGQGSLNNLTTGSSNVALGYEAGGGYSTTDGIQSGSNNIAIGNFAASGTSDGSCSNNIYIGPSTMASASGVSNSIIMGSDATSGVSNEFMIGNIDHLNIPSLTTSADGTGILLQWGGANAGWVQASGGTYNSVAKIDNAIGAANGICPLDSSTQVSPTYLPSATPTVIGAVYGVSIASGNGQYNVGYGYGALNSTSSGYQNIGIGNGTLSSLVNGSANAGVGAESLNACTTGSYNVAMGPGGLQVVTTGSSNIGVGYQSGYGITTGGSNICIGYQSGTTITTTNDNIVIGTSANVYSDLCTGAIVLGASAINTASDQLYVAPTITSFNISGLAASTGTGAGTILEFDSAGNILPSAGTYNSVSKIDTVIADLQTDIITAGTNMAIGGESFGTGVTGGDCTATGDGALKALTGGSYNTAFGYNALGSTTTNSSNVAVGDAALGSCLSDYNTAVGSSALHELTSGDSNVGCGLEAGSGVTTGSNNICIGANSASSSTDAAASGNIYIGSGAVTNATTSNAIIMGQGAVCGVSGEFNLPHIVHFYVPSLTTDTVGTGTLLQWGGNNADFILASGGTHNTVATIDEAFTQVENRQADVSYLSDYPADPTGTNDSTTAIQDAINAGKPIVQLGAGTYLVTGTLTIPSGTTLRGYGQAATTLEKTTASTGDIIDILGTTSSNTNIAIRDINFNANSIANAISTQYVSKFTVENCSFINVAAGSNAISIASAVTTDTTILNTNCLVSNCIYQTTVGSTFVYLTNAQDVTIRDCNCESTTTTAAGNGVVMAQLCSSVQVVRCLFYAMVAGINIALSCNGIRIENCDFPNISGTVSGTTNTGIQTGLAALNTALTATTINNLVITDCTTNWVYGTAIALNSCTGAVVADTSISYSSDGSLMITNCSYTTVRGCTFYNNAQGTADYAPAYNGGIHIYGPVSPYTWIVDCQFYDNQTTPTQDTPIGISYTTATTYSDIFVINCNLQSYNGASSIALADSATIGTDVWCVNCTNVTGLPAGVLNGGPTEYEYIANKGVANGYCPLDSSTQVSPTYLPSATSTVIGAVYGLSIPSANGVYNVGYGYGALNSTSSGYQNIGIGNGSLSSLVDGWGNAGIGAESLNACTSGYYNVAMGPGGLQVVTTGISNIGVGYQSGYGITTGGSNICIGYQSGTTITTTNDNIVIGTSANVYSDACSGAIVLGANAINTASDQLYVAPSITSFNISGLAASTGTGAGTILEFDSTGNILPSAGTYNSVSKIDSAIGAASGICPLDSSTQVSPTYLPPATPTTLGAMYGTPPISTSISSSLSLGANAFAIGTWSIAIGNNVLTKVDSSTIGNVAVGSLNLQNATTGQYNVAIGQGSMVNLTTGTSNVGLGYQAGGGLNSDNGFLTGNYNIAIGYYAASGTYDAAVSDNIYIGPNTATGATGVSNSIMLGSGATSSVSNEFMISNIDHLNIPSLTISADGTGTLLQWGGADAGWVQASGGTYNSVEKIDTALSDLQADIITAGTNMAIGGESFGTGVTGLHCTATGDSALKSLTSGSYNTAFGFDALNNVTTQASNVAVGDFALLSCTGNSNTAVGSSCLLNNNTGSSNTGLGWQAGSGVTTGSNNICIGTYAASSTNDAAANTNIYIGNNSVTGATGVSNSIMLGSGATSSVSNEFMINNIDHLNIPSLTTSTDGTGTLLQWGGADAGWVQASGGTYNSVSKIESAFANVQSDIASMGTIYTWDGASGTATVLADTTYSTNTILTSDLVTNTLTIDSGIVLSTAGYRIICQQLVLNGTIDNSGRAGSPGGTTSAINGDATPATSFGGGTDGASSTDGVGASAPPIPGWTFLTYTSYTAGSGASGAGGSSSAATYPSYMPYSSPYSYTLTNPTGGLLWSGPGGGAGAGDGTNYGGAGGGGGGVISISAIIISGSGGVISAVGGAGGAATAGDTGGGSGGGGGFIMLHTRQNPQTFTFTASVAGGAGGVGYGTGTAGSAGPSGQIIIINPA